MYIPKHFEESRVEVLHELMHTHPLATVVTLSDNGLNANHIPLILSPSPAPFGLLQGHVSRKNPVLSEVQQRSEVLAIFQGPNCYITPSWYATKHETGQVVPTWNYAVVHVYGSVRIVDDTSWLLSHLEALTNQHESTFAEPWKVSDAPQEYIERLLPSIVGIEIVITRLSGKYKMSQNQVAQNRAGVIAGLHTRGDENSLAIARMVAAAAKIQD
ncbi:MAG TPA: FMN-binding negative transcriptional regulator [Gammaproteobacteria bacterium]